jgi:hypothetical protein
MSNLKNKLVKLTKEELADFVIEASEKDRDLRMTLLSKLEQHLDETEMKVEKQKIYEDQYDELWSRVDEILNELNEYGMDDEDMEMEASDGLDEIAKLFKENELDHELKIELIDQLFHYYDWGNSGMNDNIMETVFAVASCDADWQHIIEKLKAKEGDYRASLAMDIYKSQLKDEISYLAVRESNLRYGVDYYDLCQFWHNKGETEKAVEIAEQGVEKGDGGIIDLIEFLAKYYRKKKDYANTLKFLRLEFAHGRSLPVYKKLEKFCKSEDWKVVEPECISALEQSHSQETLAEIYYYRKEFDRVLSYVQKQEPYFSILDRRDRFAEKLEKRYPEEIIKYYDRKIERYIQKKTRKSYGIAVSYVAKIRKVCVRILNDEEKWSEYIGSLREDYPRHPALQDELNRTLTGTN